MSSLADQINEEVLLLWQKYESMPECAIREVPLVFHKLEENKALFIGINPSSSQKGLKHIVKKTGRNFSTIEQLYPWSGKESVKLAELVAMEKDAHEHHSYFAKFREMAKTLNEDWCHIDLFFYRLKSQQDFRKITFHKKRLTSFAEDQLALAYKIIDLVGPKFILVANALACDILYDHCSSLTKNLDEHAGCYYYTLPSGKRVPTFFTSMLTGQRSLDTWSFERLVWQIRKVIFPQKQNY